MSGWDWVALIASASYGEVHAPILQIFWFLGHWREVGAETWGSTRDHGSTWSFDYNHWQAYVGRVRSVLAVCIVLFLVVGVILFSMSQGTEETSHGRSGGSVWMEIGVHRVTIAPSTLDEGDSPTCVRTQLTLDGDGSPRRFSVPRRESVVLEANAYSGARQGVDLVMIVRLGSKSREVRVRGLHPDVAVVDGDWMMALKHVSDPADTERLEAEDITLDGTPLRQAKPVLNDCR